MNRYGLVTVSIIILVAAAAFARHILVRDTVERRLARMTTATVEVRDVHWDAWRSAMHLEGLTFSNPAGFADDVAILVDRFSLTYALPSLWRRPTRLLDAELHIRHVLVVRDEKGRLNLQRLFQAAAPTETPPPTPAPPPAQPGHPPRYTVERLTVRLNEVHVRDYSRSAADPLVATYTLNWEQRFTDVQSLDDVLAGVIDSFSFVVGPSLSAELTEWID